MKYVYDYACNPTDEMDISIGNVARRLFEAFSTFMFKKGIEKVTLDESVLSLISDQHKREYFQNSMYRLVLHTESHSRERLRRVFSLIFRARKNSVLLKIFCALCIL